MKTRFRKTVDKWTMILFILSVFYFGFWTGTWVMYTLFYEDRVKDTVCEMIECKK